MYICVNLIEKCSLRFKCLIFIFFNRREREEEDNEDKTFKENLNSSLILNRARCYEELYGQELSGTSTRMWKSQIVPTPLQTF